MKRYLNFVGGILFLVGILSGFDSYCQTVNTGEFTILPGTIVSTYFDFDNRNSGKFINDGDLYLFANLNNDGEISFTNGLEGLTRFVGKESVQQIMGSRLSQLNNVLFENTNDRNAFHLFGDISVSGVSNFIQGIVVSDNFGGLMIFEKGSSHLMTSDKSHVDGYVAKRGNEAFSFPIGDAYYFRFAGISSPTDEGANFRAKYFLEDPDGLYPRDRKVNNIKLINDAEYWELFRDNGDSNVKLTLSWRDVTTPAFILGETNRLVVAGWDSTEQKWINLGGEVDFSAQTVTTPLEITDYGVFTLAVLASNITNLAIEKTSFERSIWEGDEIEYEIRVQNNSLVDATEVVIVDNLPLFVAYKDYKLESAFGLVEHSFSVIGQTLTWNVPFFMAGDEIIITLTVRAETPGKITNYAVVASFEEDEDLLDNEDTDINLIKSLFIPNVITPNGDGENDTFIIQGLNRFSKNNIVIFNRWGDHVFEKENYQNDWAANGLVAGTYFYILKLTEDSGQERIIKGWIQVVKD